MTISDALAWLRSHGMFCRITFKAASVYLRGRWTIRVRAGKAESFEKMIIRLALKAQMHEQFSTRPPTRRPSPRTKAHLRRVRSERLMVN